jgi:hypothetical protein
MVRGHRLSRSERRLCIFLQSRAEIHRKNDVDSPLMISIGIFEDASWPVLNRRKSRDFLTLRAETDHHHATDHQFLGEHETAPSLIGMSLPMNDVSQQTAIYFKRADCTTEPQ